ncbi:hypothetical protein F7725_013193 [Dissostichus mawsoni]|uniref:Phospholipid-transporting ATPase n=1 Tax=Dissostichus mawsoni TaxID=36200 RepID=A0A7J5YR75_DISMA|nr:hypothetical protein F7725_013193 [Dissostichus mawsoni]
MEISSFLSRTFGNAAQEAPRDAPERTLERKLRANDREYNLPFKYATNAIKTSKYNPFTFLPLNLFEQFQRIANAYFLFLLVLQVIPQISSLSWFTTVVPLVLVLTVTAAKDATDDINRHRSDNQVNNRKSAESKHPLSSLFPVFRLRSEKWLDVQVGDIIKLENNQFVTADLMLLSSSEPLNLVYIETAELDGETNLKVRQALTVTGDLGEDIEKLADFDGKTSRRQPSGKYAVSPQQPPGPLHGNTNLRRSEILAGQREDPTARHHPEEHRVVLWTGAVGGPETKLMQNCGKSTFKRTSIDRLMNVLVLCVNFRFLAFMCTILAIGNCFWELNEGSQFTVFLPRQDGNDAGFSAFLHSGLTSSSSTLWCPYLSIVEFIRLGNSFYIDWDRKMYYSRSDTPAEARTTTLNEELGQIKYVFSDKTGTLTQNIMTFNKCSINGKSYGDVYDYTATERVDFSFNALADPRFMFHDHSLVEAVKLENPEVHTFFRLLALCHTVMAEEKKEGALVTAARNFGFVFRSRTPDSVSIVEMGQQRSYELLAILDFNNVRKRMSVIVRSPEGSSLSSVKAQTRSSTRLHRSCSKLMDVTTEQLNEFAGEGLRTLVLAYKDLDEGYFNEWKRRHHEASTLLDDRESKLDELYEEIEKDLLLLGASAIEDKLQDGVPQTIEQLSKADIKIWVLTGDKQETAENIGYSCNLLREEMNDVFIISANSPEDVRLELRDAQTSMKPGEDSVFLPEGTLGKGVKVMADEAVNGEYGLVINGHSLAYALERSMELEFLRTACMCKAVICCRVTPLQKAQVVELVKKYKGAVTLAIGDGANDVSMIKAAHIGVGISGQEGMQAVLSSDYSFAQFRFLQRLLLVHGRWSYLRMCKFLRYFFYKNFTFTFVHFWFAFFCGFSAQVCNFVFQTVYDEWFITLYNLVYTALPVLGMSLFDQQPQLYVPGQLNLYFSKKAFFKCALHSCYSSLVLFFIPYAAMHDTVRGTGRTSPTTSPSPCSHRHVCFLPSPSSLVMYFVVTFTMYSNGMFLMSPSAFPFIAQHWLTILLTSILCVLPVVTYRFLFIQLCPTINDKMMFKVRQAKATPAPPPRRTRIRRTSSRRSGYAFSHAQGYGDLVTSGRFLRRPALSRSSGLTNAGRTTTGFSPMGRSAGYSPTGRPQNAKVPDVEVTSLQMYRTITDPSL